MGKLHQWEIDDHQAALASLRAVRDELKEERRKVEALHVELKRERSRLDVQQLNRDCVELRRERTRLIVALEAAKTRREQAVRIAQILCAAAHNRSLTDDEYERLLDQATKESVTLLALVKRDETTQPHQPEVSS